MTKHLSRALAMTGFFVLAPAMVMAMGGRPNDGDEEAANGRIQPVAKIKLAGTQASASAVAGARSGEELYKTVCGACHETGVAGSPKTGDKAAWAPRIGVGLDALAKSAKAGKGAMPPKGGSDATDEELARATVFMANKSGANFKEPAASLKPMASEKNP